MEKMEVGSSHMRSWRKSYSQEAILFHVVSPRTLLSGPGEAGGSCVFIPHNSVCLLPGREWPH